MPPKILEKGQIRGQRNVAGTLITKVLGCSVRVCVYLWKKEEKMQKQRKNEKKKEQKKRRKPKKIINVCVGALGVSYSVFRLDSPEKTPLAMDVKALLDRSL